MGMGSRAEGFCPPNHGTGSARPPWRGHGTWSLVQSVEQERAGLGERSEAPAEAALPAESLVQGHRVLVSRGVTQVRVAAAFRLFSLWLRAPARLPHRPAAVLGAAAAVQATVR